MKVKYDYSKLRGRIIEKFKTLTNFAKAMGMSLPAVTQRLKNLTYFKQDEIDKACVILNIENYNIADYFFTQLVQKNWNTIKEIKKSTS